MTDAAFVTVDGHVAVRLMPDHAPKTVANFVELATGSRSGRMRATAFGAPSRSTTGRSSTA